MKRRLFRAQGKRKTAAPSGQADWPTKRVGTREAIAEDKGKQLTGLPVCDKLKRRLDLANKQIGLSDRATARLWSQPQLFHERADNMSSMIDTLAIAKRLQQANDTPEHFAEAIADEFGHALQNSAVMKYNLEAAVAKLEHKITQGVLQVTGVLTGVIVGVAAIAVAIVLPHIK